MHHRKFISGTEKLTQLASTKIIKERKGMSSLIGRFSTSWTRGRRTKTLLGNTFISVWSTQDFFSFSMDLDYLPHILIVPTGSIPGKTSTLRCFGITLSGVNKRLKVPSSLSHRQSLQWMYVDKGHFWQKDTSTEACPWDIFLTWMRVQESCWMHLGLASLELEIILIWTLKIQLRNDTFNVTLEETITAAK